ncbi:MAG TPA: hypothetical protein VMT46_11340 [Anaerolineaceae bacterium]|nr:hypothetical protein [Anaerolineaceae bacterium]
MNANLNPTIRTVIAACGIICGVSGLEHGFFETLQGNVAPAGQMISAIGPAQRFWPGGIETAFTIVPNFLVTGILAMLFSLAVIVWSAGFLQRRGAALVFLLLSVAQFMVGGGFAQIFLVILAAAGATQIHGSLRWLRGLPAGLRRAFGTLWLPGLVVFGISFAGAIWAAIFGYFPLVSDLYPLQGEALTAFLWGLADVMLVTLPLAILAALARDSLPGRGIKGERRSNSYPVA